MKFIELGMLEVRNSLATRKDGKAVRRSSEMVLSEEAQLTLYFERGKS